jgi:hypothetical protein
MVSSRTTGAQSVSTESTIRPFSPPIEAPAGADLTLRVTSAQPKGQDIIADIEARNGSLVHQDRVKLRTDSARAQFVKRLAAAHDTTDRKAANKALLGLRLLTEAALKAAAEEARLTVEEAIEEAATQADDGDDETPDGPAVVYEWLDAESPSMKRPLTLHEGRPTPQRGCL